MTTPRPIRPLVVFFDIGNVLLKFDAREAAGKIARQLRLAPKSLLRRLATSKLVDSVERGLISPRELYAHFHSRLGYQGSFAQFKSLWCEHFKFNRRSASLLKALARRYRVYLLSNTNRLHYEHIRRRYAFPRQAHGAVLSHELGLRKPEPAIFRAALKIAKARPSQAVFIDDLKANVEAARRLGIYAIHHTPATDLKRELAKLGLLS